MSIFVKLLKIKQNIPNFLTCCNLLCGCISITCALEGNLVWSSILVGIAAVFDFLDGFAARILGVSSPIGKDLDSLADMVTFGVVPGVAMHTIMLVSYNLPMDLSGVGGWHTIIFENFFDKLQFFAFYYIFPFTVTIFSAIRLAKFNNDTRQTESFIGLPTPANAIFIMSLPVILFFQYGFVEISWGTFELMHGSPHIVGSTRYSDFQRMVVSAFLNPYVLSCICIIQSFLLVAPIPLFALKFKSFGWKGNEIRYVFLGLSLGLLLGLQYLGIPLIIILYILMSLINNLIQKRN